MHIRDYVEHLKSKPEDVRRRIALGSSVGITAIVAVGWMVALGASGTLALSAPADDGATTGLADAASATQNGFAGLLGAASAFQAGTGDSGEPALTIVGGQTSSTLETKADENEGKTVIPF